MTAMYGRALFVSLCGSVSVGSFVSRVLTSFSHRWRMLIPPLEGAGARVWNSIDEPFEDGSDS